VIVALLADVHSNLEALRACLRHAADRGVGRYAFLGDLVGYGADPGPVVDTVADFASRGAMVVKGNHDAAIEQGTRELNDATHQSIEWTRNALTPQQKQFLASLPLSIRAFVSGRRRSAARRSSWSPSTPRIPTTSGSRRCSGPPSRSCR
jgi:predicted phosphodiesterase